VVVKNNKQWLGARILDAYLTRIFFLNMDAPKKGSESFKPWLAAYKQWMSNKMKTQVIFFTDGAFWQRKRRGVAACVYWNNEQWSEEKREWCTAASSFDAELAACEIAITWLLQHTDIKSATIITDNKAAINALFDTNTHSNQNTSIRICMAARDWLSQSPEHTLHISWCPSHTGITGNEHVDRLANREKDESVAPAMLRKHFVQGAKLQAQQWWKARYRSPNYVGNSWLALKCNKALFGSPVRLWLRLVRLGLAKPAERH
jgi:ribonuclease HI